MNTIGASDPFIQQLLAGLAGAAIGFLGSIAAVWLDHRRTRREAEAKRRRDAISLLEALEAELEELWEQYVTKARPFILGSQKGQPLNFFWPTYHDYFTVFTALAGRLGEIPTPATRRLIIQYYISAKGLLDSIAFNSRQLDDYFRLTGGAAPMTAAATRAHNEVVRYGDGIRDADPLLEDLFKRTLAGIREDVRTLRQH